MCRSRESIGAPQKDPVLLVLGQNLETFMRALGLSKKLLDQIYEMLVRFAEESNPRDECKD